MSTAQDMLAAYIAAEQAVLKGQAYTLGDRRVTLADLEMIRRGRQEWERRVAQEQARAAGARRGPAVAGFGP